MRIREVEKAIAVLLSVTGEGMPLENQSFFVELGPPEFSPDDFVIRRRVQINGVDMGRASVDRIVDDIVALEK